MTHCDSSHFPLGLSVDSKVGETILSPHVHLWVITILMLPSGTEQVGMDRLSKVLKGDPWCNKYMCALPRCPSVWGITKAVMLLEAKVRPEEMREEA